MFTSASSAAVRPLHSGEFLYLISCSKTILGREPSKSEILDKTSNFLEDDRVESRPKFVHLSAKEYLDPRQEFIPAVSNTVAAVPCLNSLSVNWNLTTQSYTCATLYLGNHLSSATPDHRLPSREILKQFLVLDLEKVEFKSHLFINPDRAASLLPRLFIIWKERMEILYQKRLLRMSMVDSADMYLASPVSTLPDRAVCAMGLEDMLSVLPPFTVENKVAITVTDLSSSGRDSLGQYKNRTCIELAVILNRPQVLRQLYAMGYKLNKRNWKQETLLHLAAELGLADVVVLLLFSGVNPNILSGDRKGVPAPYPFPSKPGGTGSRPSRPQTAMGFRTYGGGKSGVINPFYVKQERKAAIHLARSRSQHFVSGHIQADSG